MRRDDPEVGGDIVVQLYPKGANEFDARGQFNGYACRYVLTWRRS
jgi:hypothetical protein